MKKVPIGDIIKKAKVTRQTRPKGGEMPMLKDLLANQRISAGLATQEVAATQNDNQLLGTNSTNSNSGSQKGKESAGGAAANANASKTQLKGLLEVAYNHHRAMNSQTESHLAAQKH